MDSDRTKRSRCDGCGLEIEGGSIGCQELFDSLIARDFTDVKYFGVHRMLVDTYSLQHPDRYCQSAKSLAAHLVGLCSILESRASSAVGEESLTRWLDGKSPVEKPTLPSSRGQLTIGHLSDASAPEAHARAVEEWAQATWEAYSSLHDLAREWYERAVRSAQISRHD